MRTYIKFLLNGQTHKLSDFRPDTTLLNWLRQNKGLTGSKEGCAEGDCGACTVMISKLDPDGQTVHHCVNSCILFLPMLDGTAITTIEGVAGPEGQLHPVQQAMIDNHGAQCGFCTPGFVMALYTGWCQNQTWTSTEIERLLAGNLCRCTGYGPIVKAGQSLAEASIPDWEKDRNTTLLNFLSQQDGQDDDMRITDGQQIFDQPKSVQAAAKIYADNPEAQIIAGATDIGLWVTKQHRQLNHLIHLGRIPELANISYEAESIIIGAAVTHQKAFAELKDEYYGLQDVWSRFGSTQVRHSGTVCGNIANASPIGDLSPCFLALSAELVLNKAGKIRQLPLDEFFIDYGKQNRQKAEFIQAVILPRLKADQHFFAYKISRRFDQDISAVLMAVCMEISNDIIQQIKIGFGGMAALPKRAYHTEKALVGQSLDQAFDPALLDLLEQDFSPIDDVRASKSYRLQVAKNLLQKIWLEYRSGFLRLSAPDRFRLPEDFTEPFNRSPVSKRAL